MRAAADRMAPNSSDILKGPTAYFRRGTSGNGTEVLTSEELRSYYERAGGLASSDLLAWLHR